MIISDNPSTVHTMDDWTSLHEFHSNPIRFAHASWLSQYPSSLVKECMESTVCRRLLTKCLLDMHPCPLPHDFEVPEELAWALGDADDLRELAARVSVMVFAPNIRRLISRSRIDLLINAIGSENFLSALQCSDPLRVEGDVVDVMSRINDEAILREFFVDVGWTCLLQLLQSRHTHLAWRFKLLGRNLQTDQRSPWKLRCESNTLLQKITELTCYGAVA
jgi:YOP proteins translocation protein K (YscK)